MNKLKLFLSQNNWEYTGIVNIKHEQEYLFDNTKPFLDIMGEPTPNVIVVDGVRIEFDEGFEWEEIND